MNGYDDNQIFVHRDDVSELLIRRTVGTCAVTVFAMLVAGFVVLTFFM